MGTKMPCATVLDAARIAVRMYYAREANIADVSTWIGDSAERLLAFYTAIETGSNERRAFMDALRGVRDNPESFKPATDSLKGVAA